MYKHTFTGIVAMVLACVGCHPQESNTKQAAQTDSVKPIENVYTMNAALLKKHKELQMRLEASEDGSYPIYKYTETDVNVALPAIAEGLKAQHFVQLSDDAFKAKIRSIFGDVFDPGSCDTKKHEQFITLFDGKKKEDEEYWYTVDNIFISTGYHFITHVPLVGDFIEFTDSTHYKIQLLPTMVSRNKYLLNDSKADLAILLANDSVFLKRLVKQYGYTKEPRINDLAMNDYARMDDNHIGTVGEAIFVKDCKGKMSIREDLLTWIKDHTTAEDHRLLDGLNWYASALYDNSGSTEFTGQKPFELWSLEEKRKIVAYVANIYVPLFHALVPKNPATWPAGTILENLFLEDKGLRDYLIQQQYFGLPELRKEIEPSIVK